MRIKRPEWQVEQTRDKIRQAALELFRLQGFQEVTMRKIARRAGFSPTAIYLYYPAKDALYLEILKDGFENLLRFLQTETDPMLPPVERIRCYTQVYLKFSQEYSNHYDLMFSYPVPKYLDYVGTEMEHLAWDEKRWPCKTWNCSKTR